MKMRNFWFAMASGMILAAPALAAGAAGDSAVATELVPSREQLGAGSAGLAQYDPQQEQIMGISCPPGPIMEDVENPPTGNGADFRKGAGVYRQVIEGQAGIISL